MSHKIIPMGLNKKIALVAHDNKKRDLVDWALFNRVLLAQFRALALEAPDAAVGSPPSRPGPPAPMPGPAPSAAPEPVRGSGASPSEALTDKEARILDLLAQGLSNRQIAAAVFLAEGTVKNYVSRIMEKLHASSRLELAVRAVARKA